METKSNRVKITRSVKKENAEKLRDLAYYTRRTQGEILDDLLSGYSDTKIKFMNYNENRKTSFY